MALLSSSARTPHATHLVSDKEEHMLAVEGGLGEPVIMPTVACTRGAGGSLWWAAATASRGQRAALCTLPPLPVALNSAFCSGGEARGAARRAVVLARCPAGWGASPPPALLTRDASCQGRHERGA